MKRGFSLVEIVITIVVLATLAMIGIPGFLKTKNKNDASQAVTYLRAIRLAEKMYYAKNGVYLACTDNDAIRDLGPEITNGSYSYTVTRPTATTFTATATATIDGKTITLNQDGTWGGDSSYKPSV